MDRHINEMLVDQQVIFRPWRVFALHTFSTAATLALWPPSFEQPMMGMLFACIMSLVTTMAFYNLIPKEWLP